MEAATEQCLATAQGEDTLKECSSIAELDLLADASPVLFLDSDFNTVHQTEVNTEHNARIDAELEQWLKRYPRSYWYNLLCRPEEENPDNQTEEIGDESAELQASANSASRPDYCRGEAVGSRIEEEEAAPLEKAQRKLKYSQVSVDGADEPAKKARLDEPCELSPNSKVQHCL